MAANSPVKAFFEIIDLFIFVGTSISERLGYCNGNAIRLLLSIAPRIGKAGRLRTEPPF